MSRQNDGKEAEGKVTAHLKKLSSNKDWWYHRLPDAAV